MNNSNSPADPSSSRATLKLKGAMRKPPEDNKVPPNPRPPENSKSKPGAQWSDEYKQRMQADMDKLTRG